MDPKTQSRSFRRFKIVHHDKEVVVEVDPSILSTKLATAINSFWSGGTRHIAADNGDAVLAVVRWFGVQAIRHMLEDGGTVVSENDALSARILTHEVQRLDGWGGIQLDTVFGECGMRIVSASVYPPSFDSVQIEEVACQS